MGGERDAKVFTDFSSGRHFVFFVQKYFSRFFLPTIVVFVISLDAIDYSRGLQGKPKRFLTVQRAIADNGINL
jgi:hypothetical protein